MNTAKLKAQRQPLHNMIDRFLDEHRAASPGGGWAEITGQDLIQLDQIISKLIDLKCGPDAGGDRPISFRLTNRRETRSLHYVAVPYDHFESRGKHSDAESIAAIMYNLRMAVADFQQMDHVRRIEDVYQSHEKLLLACKLALEAGVGGTCAIDVRAAIDEAEKI